MPTTKNQLLSWLKENRHLWVSGEQISNRLGISRTAIWKHINSLKGDGHQIESAPKKGYRLQKSADLIIKDEIQSRLQTRVMGHVDIVVFQETDSTNLQAKALAVKGAEEGTVVVADTQSHGRGRRGRTWYSPSGQSIYMSIILRPPMSPSQAPQITLMTAVALAKTLNESAELNAKIKWPNDILVGGKKIAGILTEISTEMDMVDYVVVGLGININTRKKEMPTDIQQIATSIRNETGTDTSRTSLLCGFLKNFESCYNELKENGFGPIMAQWRSMTDIIGQRVYVDVLNTRHTGVVDDVDDDGVLILKDDQGVMHRIFSGDVMKVRPD